MNFVETNAEILSSAKSAVATLKDGLRLRIRLSRMVYDSRGKCIMIVCLPPRRYLQYHRRDIRAYFIISVTELSRKPSALLERPLLLSQNTNTRAIDVPVPGTVHTCEYVNLVPFCRSFIWHESRFHMALHELTHVNLSLCICSLALS